MADRIFYAHRDKGRDGSTIYFTASPDRRWVALHGFDLPIVTVTVRERLPSDAEPAAGAPDYWGWDDAKDGLMFVWPSRMQVEIRLGRRGEARQGAHGPACYRGGDPHDRQGECRMRTLLIFLLAMSACNQPGTVDGPCLPDGTCHGGLECRTIDNGNSYCYPPVRCRYESECFCATCADKCGATGVAECNFSDTSTWGNKTPATCRCK